MMMHLVIPGKEVLAKSPGIFETAKLFGKSGLQVLNCEEYSPSRRSKAPIWPRSVQRSAASTMSSLYAAVNLRRTGFSRTSGSGPATFPLFP